LPASTADLAHPDTAGRRRWRSVLVFAAASLLVVGLGAAVMAQDGAAPGLWLRNPVAWIVAGALAIFLAQRGWLTAWIAPIALAVIALSLIGPEQEGVHRWLGLGPVQLNAAALILPVAIATFSRERAWLAIACFTLTAAILALQPDISQLAAFAPASIILCTARFGWRGAASFVVAAGAIAFCLTRVDPLDPVPHVEGIFSLAFSQSPGIAIAMAASLAVAALSPLLLWPIATARWTALALASYFAATALAFLLGAYPVPLAGYGLSFVVGWWLGFAAISVPRPGPIS
jgi:cell division protein FtsW (lipid II flippase)